MTLFNLVQVLKFSNTVGSLIKLAGKLKATTKVNPHPETLPLSLEGLHCAGLRLECVVCSVQCAV